jgi:hypothetical protein|tara:strand:- start:334 stop:693 length:360 start_codon:yes stop_codon:yes gene_type:complete
MTQEINFQDESSVDFVRRAVMATTINWSVVEKWTKELKYNSSDEMVFDYALDSELVFKRGVNRSISHRGIRINLEKMLFCGISSAEEMINNGLKLTKLQKEQIEAAKEESEDWEQITGL